MGKRLDARDATTRIGPDRQGQCGPPDEILLGEDRPSERSPHVSKLAPRDRPGGSNRGIASPLQPRSERIVGHPENGRDGGLARAIRYSCREIPLPPANTQEVRFEENMGTKRHVSLWKGASPLILS